MSWQAAVLILLAVVLLAHRYVAGIDRQYADDPVPGLRVNVNTADAAQLALLPRVGPAVAQRILEFREENGSFESLDELMLVRGIGEKTFELIEPWASTEGPTTLTEKAQSTDETE